MNYALKSCKCVSIFYLSFPGRTTSKFMCLCLCLCLCERKKERVYIYKRGLGSSVGLATDYGLGGLGSKPVGTKFSGRPDGPWGLPNLLQNGHCVFPARKLRPGRAADHSPSSSAAVVEE